MSWRKVCLLPLLLAFASCNPEPKPIDVEKFLQDFIGSYLAMSPVTATQIGFHNYEGVNLDSILDDYSEKGVRGLRILYNSMHVDAGKLDSKRLSPEVREDFNLIRQTCEAQLFDLDQVQTYRRNPTMYVELIGQAIEGPFTLSYAPEADRFRQIIARLNKVPQFFETAKSNLVDSPAVWNAVAQSENEGNIDLIDHQVRARVPAGLKGDYDGAAGRAIAAIHSFNAWLASTSKQHGGDWRLGSDLYRKKFAYTLANGEAPEDTLRAAEAKLVEIRAGMKAEAARVWPKYFPRRKIPKDEQSLIADVLERIAQEHTTPDRFFDEAKADVASATAFVRQHHLVMLPAVDNLKVIPTPQFMRGVYGVAGFQPAPPLEPSLGAFFWITPFEASMPKQDVESKLREYNKWGLETIVIHEAMPGHFVQFQYANGVDPRSRAVLREMLSNGPYVEGWAVYATQMMVEQGYDSSPEMKLTFDKQMLRVVANAILDVKLQTQGMTDEQALDLMIRETFQERQEAVAKLQRAKLTSCQLPTYFAGWQAWLKLRDDYRAKFGDRFDLTSFHDAALKEGALPMPDVRRLLLR
jgi:uncharacterized protein (DUF885 family)